MRKITFKLLKILALTGAVTVGAAALSSCGLTAKEYDGDYHYPNPWSSSAPDYGVEVAVSVQSDVKGERIRSVKLKKSEYTEVTDSWDGKDIWQNGLDGLLSAYRGKYLADVLCETVRFDGSYETGEPISVSDGELTITGATVGSGRVLLAVQDALEDAAESLGYEVREGDYHYPNAWAPDDPHYGVCVRAVVKDGKILAVGIVDSGYTEVTESWSGKSQWNNGIENLLESYKGKKVSDILGLEVTVSESGEPQSVSDSDYVISGATQGSGRLLLAIQSALK